MFRRDERSPIVAALYGVIVAQARCETFYRHYGVPDDVEGRFDMIVLHVVLFFRRVREGALRDLGQAVFDLFCRDMDHNLREMGISDQAIPKRMRAVGEAFYGRAANYEGSLAAGDAATLAIALARNVFASERVEEGARRLAAYTLEAVQMLADLPDDVIAGGALQFPDPEAICVSMVETAKVR